LASRKLIKHKINLDAVSGARRFDQSDCLGQCPSIAGVQASKKFGGDADVQRICAPNIEIVLLPIEFDPEFYHKTYPDLVDHSPSDLYEHFLVHGISEGRFGTLYAGRAGFLGLVAEAGSILEIGPFFAPVATGPNVKYFDVLATPDLITRGTSLGHDVSKVPEVDYVSPNGDLSIITESFDAVLSSHCIEHQPSLIRHLEEVYRLLNPGGSFYLIIPDKRYCFDHFLPISTIADVLEANDDRTVHSVRNLVEHRALMTHNDPVKHWAGDHGEPGPPSQRVDLIKASLAEHSSTEYIDVHAWKFVPETFRQIMEDLVNLGYSNLVPERVYNTPFNCHEFCAVLTKQN
jgi:SAM-dependent methyltransferase